MHDAHATSSPRFLFGANPIIEILAKTKANNKRRVHASRAGKTGEGRIEEYGQASRAISTASLNTSLCLHSQPIKQVVFLRPSGALRPRET